MKWPSRRFTRWAADLFGVALLSGGLCLEIEAQTLPPGVHSTPPTVVGDDAWIDSDTTFNVLDGGVVGESFNAGSTDGSSSDVVVNILGGMVDRFFNANAGSTVNVGGGTVSGFFTANSGSTINISGGKVFTSRANSGSVVNVGGGVLTSFSSRSGSELNVQGGTIGSFGARSGSDVVVSGGLLGRLTIDLGSSVEFRGGDFMLNGAPFAGSSITLVEGDFFTGTYADGSPFFYSPVLGDAAEGVTLTPAPPPPIDTTQIVIDGSSPPAPYGLRVGQTLTLRDGGELGDYFLAFDANLNVEGGVLGDEVEILGSAVNVSGGTIGDELQVLDGSTVNISGGAVGAFLKAHTGSTVNISGGTVGINSRALAGSTVNISGGAIAERLTAESGSTVNVSGGEVGPGFRANDGSTVNVSGGVVGHNSRAGNGSIVTLNGGTIGHGFAAESGSATRIVGGEFRLNGSPFSESTITLAADDVFTGTLADGSPFVFSNPAFDSLPGVALTPFAPPPIDTTPIVVDGASPAAPPGLRAGQSLTLREGGTLGDYFAVVDADLVIEGGEIGTGLEAARSTVTLSGGTVGGSLYADNGATVNIGGAVLEGTVVTLNGSTVSVTGGSVDRFSVSAGGVVDVSGGVVGGPFIAKNGSSVHVSGGDVGYLFQAYTGSSVRISGGSVGPYFNDPFILGGQFPPELNGDIEFVGGEFLLNGLPYTDSSITLATGDVFTGTFADGSPFVFSSSANYIGTSAQDNLQGVTLTPAPLPPIDATPIVVDGSGPAPPGLRAGQTLTLRDGGTLEVNFAVVDADLSIEGGEVGAGLELARSTAAIAGGTVAGFRAEAGSTVSISGGDVSSVAVESGATVRISGGTVGPFTAYESAVEITGGTVGNGSTADEGSTVNIRGGSVGFFFTAFTESTVNLSGGSVGVFFRAVRSSTVNISGTEFFVDGTPATLTPGVPTEIAVRDVPLSGVLADGSAFEFDLNSSSSGAPKDAFDPDATLTLTLVPTPGDYNGDGVVDATDADAWRLSYGDHVPHFSGADGNGDGVIDGADYSVWRDAMAGASSTTTVPEPSTGVVIALALAGFGGRSPRRSRR